MTKWTTEQQNAIDARGSNILVSAAAGSGKTAVLVERAVRLITDEVNGTDIDRLLIVTFTNAAAAEMKARLSKSLSQIIREHPNNTNALRQLSLLPNARIGTIDSFCMNLVRENFFKLNLAQDFTILDNSQEQLIEQTAIDGIAEELYQENRQEFKELVELLSTTKNDDDLIKTVKRVYHYLSAQPFPFDWLEEVASVYDPSVSFETSPVYAALMEEIARQLDYCRRLIADARAVLTPDDEMFSAYHAMLSEDEQALSAIETAVPKGWNSLLRAIETTSFLRAPSSPRGYVSDQKEVVTANRELYKDVVKKDMTALVAISAEDIQADNERLYPLFQELIAIIRLYSDRMMAMKREMNAYSFSDIEHFAIELLLEKDGHGEIVRTPLAESLAADFDYIMVDEYQDTNALQDLLFKMLSDGTNRFMVGDVKQSIYRFRLAMPQIFTDKKNRYAPYQPDSRALSQKIILDKNFRSREGICSLTNFLFSNLMSEAVGGLQYTEEEYLNPQASYPETAVPSAQLKLIDLPADCDPDEYEATLLAAEIVKKIERKEQIKDGDGTRDICYGDMAVLFRSSKNRMPLYAKIFAQYGIPTVSNNRINLFENNEVAILVSLLRVIDNPVQDVPLLATLMSPFYGYTPDDIAAARVAFKAPNLYSSVAADQERFSAFTADLEKYRKYAASMSVECLLRQILGDTSYLSVIAAMGNYEQRRLNVMKLIELAKRFDAGESIGLTAFVRYLDAVIESKLEVESADISSAGDNCVTLMSVHKSKGLEYPIIFLAGSAHRYNMDDLHAPVLLNSKLGVGLKINDEALLYRYNSVQYTCMRCLNHYELMNENLRVLYVAVTRAKEQFIAYAAYKNLEGHIDKLSKKIIDGTVAPYTVKGISNDGDLLLLCALLHPDGRELRRCCSKRVLPQSVDFPLDIQLISDSVATEEPLVINAAPDPDLVEAIRHKLSFTYQKAALSGFAAKRTASSLDETEQSYRFFATSKPAFMTGDTMTGAEKGTAMHQFMQHCDFKAAAVDIETEINRLKEHGFLSEKQSDALNREKLQAFFCGELARRIRQADRVYREFKVASFVPVNELEPTEETEPVLVQGIADCVFEENGVLILVDYKTDVVSKEEELLSLYRKQVSFYRSAVAKTLQMPVKEAMLYSFSLSKPCVYK
ncbi:MAG: helicase-exonuclease AddAB subunit AddA [Eubacterium sp.]|nr:helicase-exonuclease AddAB subunit AddA [Eubacterium sp.]